MGIAARSFHNGPRLAAVLLACAIVFCAARPAVAGEVREPAVAGLFYPEDAAELSKTVKDLLARAEKKPLAGRLRGLVVPHAGYRFSGPVAASAYAEVGKGDFSKVLLLGVSHRSRFAGACVSGASFFKTPLGAVPISPEARKIAALPGMNQNGCPDGEEHSLEVQLPFLQTVLDGFSLIPVMVSEARPETLAKRLAPFVDDFTLVVASSDLSHYYSYERASALDAICAEAVPNLDFSKITHCQACGIVPMATLMALARDRGWKGVLLDLRNSADTAGPMRQVVGYMAVAFVDENPAGTKAAAKASPPPPPGEAAKGASMESSFSEKDRADLLTLARSVIASKLDAGTSVTRPENPSPVMAEKRGVFVTLHKNGALRGCIGTIEPVMPLLEGVEQDAAFAAFQDPRFMPLGLDELSKVDIEISVLTVPKPLEHDGPEDLIKKLRPGIDGVILSKGGRRATFLPQVWEQLPNPENFLINLCRKAGFTPNCWRDPDVLVETYQAEHFGESQEPSP